MSEFTVGDLIAVQTENRPEFNSRVWEVQEIVETAPASASASASRRLILVSADGLLDDDGFLKRISVAEDRCTFLAVVPLLWRRLRHRLRRSRRRISGSLGTCLCPGLSKHSSS